MDTVDSKALGILVKNARTTWAVLAEELGLSPPAAAERVRKMEESGMIRGYTAILDPDLLGYPLTAFTAVTLNSNSERSTFLSTIEQIPEILECHHVTGDDDYLLKIRCKGTVDLDRLLNEFKTNLGVGRSRTTIVLSTSKETTALPIASTKSASRR
jgi:Lrp/AsnC family leucine-responsive transcriptional regulator